MIGLHANLSEENILFNLPYDEERYKKTLKACALESDLLILEDGDESEIGERGVGLILSSDIACLDRHFRRSTCPEVRKLEVSSFSCLAAVNF